MNIIERNQTGERGLLVEYDAGLISPKHNQKFITEVTDIQKSVSEGKPFNFKVPKLYGVMQKYGVENKNGRIYPEELLRREMANYMRLVEVGASAGETDHPESAVISISNTAMRISKLWWEGRSMMGEIYLPITRGYIERGIISHPADKIAHDIIHGFQYGVSSRGVGSLENIGGKNIVQDDFEIICWDFVTTPSTIGAWVFTDPEKTKPFKEGVEPSEYEQKSTIGNNSKKKDDMFDYFSERKKKSINDALSNFLGKF
jgi:hypothetical protein